MKKFKYYVFVDGIGVGGTNNIQNAREYCKRLLCETDEKIEIVDNETEQTIQRFN